MKIVSITSPQGVAIELVTYERTVSERTLSHYRTMMALRREQRNRIDRKRSSAKAGK